MLIGNKEKKKGLLQYIVCGSSAVYLNNELPIDTPMVNIDQNRLVGGSPYSNTLQYTSKSKQSKWFGLTKSNHPQRLPPKNSGAVKDSMNVLGCVERSKPTRFGLGPWASQTNQTATTPFSPRERHEYVLSR